MKTRVLTGACILAATVLFVGLKQFHSIYFDMFALIIVYGSLFEVVRLKFKHKEKFDKYEIFFIPLIQLLIYIFVDFRYALLSNALLAIVFLLYSMANEIVVYAIKRKNNETEKNVSVLNQNLFINTKENMALFAYPVLPLSFLFALNHMPYHVSYIGIILTFVIAMMTDTMAYLIGKFFGKTKFIPEVSPNKTVAGVFGGFVGGLIGVAICLPIFMTSEFSVVFENYQPGIVVCVFMALALLASFATQMGDLIESAMKRKYNVKDSSNIFPGHGGFMDRVDGMMFVSATCYVVLALFLV